MPSIRQNDCPSPPTNNSLAVMEGKLHISASIMVIVLIMIKAIKSKKYERIGVLWYIKFEL